MMPNRTTEVQTKSAELEEVLVEHQHDNLMHREQIIEDHGAARRALNFRINQSIYLIFGVLETVIGLRVVLKMIGANPDSPFARLLYGVTDLFLFPFAGLVSNPTVTPYVFEVTTLIAMAVYLFAGWLLVKLIELLMYRANTRMVSTYQEQRQPR